MKMTVRKRRTRIICSVTAGIIAIITAAAVVLGCSSNIDKSRSEYKIAEKQVRAYARENGIDFNKYPCEIIDLLARNPETEDYVMSYPACKDKNRPIRTITGTAAYRFICSGTNGGATKNTAAALQD